MKKFDEKLKENLEALRQLVDREIESRVLELAAKLRDKARTLEEQLEQERASIKGVRAELDTRTKELATEHATSESLRKELKLQKVTLKALQADLAGREPDEEPVTAGDE